MDKLTKFGAIFAYIIQCDNLLGYEDKIDFKCYFLEIELIKHKCDICLDPILYFN